MSSTGPGRDMLGRFSSGQLLLTGLLAGVDDLGLIFPGGFGGEFGVELGELRRRVFEEVFGEMVVLGGIVGGMGVVLQVEGFPHWVLRVPCNPTSIFPLPVARVWV